MFFPSCIHVKVMHNGHHQDHCVHTITNTNLYEFIIQDHKLKKHLAWTFAHSDSNSTHEAFFSALLRFKVSSLKATWCEGPKLCLMETKILVHEVLILSI